MAEVHGNAQDPLFHRPRFGRLLRQAQDAGIVDLAKNERGFEMTLRAEAGAPAAEPQPERAGEASRARRGRRGGRGRGERREMLHAPEDTEPAEAPPEPEEAPPVAAPAPPALHVVKRGLRFRRGSGGPAVPPGGVPLVGVVEMDKEEAPKEKPRRRSRAGGTRRAGGRSRGKKTGEEPSSES